MARLAQWWDEGRSGKDFHWTIGQFGKYLATPHIWASVKPNWVKATANIFLLTQTLFVDDNIIFLDWQHQFLHFFKSYLAVDNFWHAWSWPNLLQLPFNLFWLLYCYHFHLFWTWYINVSWCCHSNNIFSLDASLIQNSFPGRGYIGTRKTSVRK